jgi:hypothetical protein
VANLIPARLSGGDTVGLLGLPDNVIDESQGAILAQQVLKKTFCGVVDESPAMGNATRVLTGNVTFAGSAVECAESADVPDHDHGLARASGTPAGEFENQYRALRVVHCIGCSTGTHLLPRRGIWLWVSA